MRLLRAVFNFLRNSGIGKIPGAMTMFNHVYLFLTRFKKEAIIHVNGHRLHITISDLSTRQLLLGGQYHEAIENLFSKIIKKSSVVVDVGANIGYLTLHAARLTGPHGKVIAFEPDMRSFRLLEANVQLNDYRHVVLVRKAVTNQNGCTRLFLHPNYTTLNSLSAENITSTYVKPDGYTETETVTLGSYFETFMKNRKLDLLKMNIQGSEGLAINGAEGLLHDHGPFIITEFWPEGLKHVGTDPASFLLQLSNIGYTWKPISQSADFKNLSIENVISLANDVLHEQRRSLLLFLRKN